MTIIKLADYIKDREAEGNVPLCITFFGAKFQTQTGHETALNITVNVEDGDIMRILRAVKEEGGIGQFHNGQYLYLPWPCACVVMHTPDRAPFEIDPHFERASEDASP
jgi:hypothetical protein